jgi:ATP-dependent Zn protease
LFDQAKKAAPAYIFDEIDAVGASAAAGPRRRNTIREQTLNQLL